MYDKYCFIVRIFNGPLTHVVSADWDNSNLKGSMAYDPCLGITLTYC
jgi:hypothetical protein